MIAAETNRISAKSRVLLVIPAYNEAGCIAHVVDEIVENFPQYDYVVVNDGSRDDTAAICTHHGYNLLNLPINLGLAGAFQAGMKYSYYHDYDCAIQFDADGQHDPKYLDDLVDNLEGYDIAIGSRFVTQPKPHSARMLGSDLISAMIRITTGKKIKDPTSGMRAYSRKIVKDLAFGPNLGPEPDTLSYLIKKKSARVVEVQVSMNDRFAGESYLNVRNSISYMVRMSLSVLFIQFFR